MSGFGYLSDGFCGSFGVHFVVGWVVWIGGVGFFWVFENWRVKLGCEFWGVGAEGKDLGGGFLARSYGDGVQGVGRAGSADSAVREALGTLVSRWGVAEVACSGGAEASV
jgi:hypothetical protein